MRSFGNSSTTSQLLSFCSQPKSRYDSTTRFADAILAPLQRVTATCRKVVTPVFDQVDPRTRDTTSFYDSSWILVMQARLHSADCF